MAEWRTGRKVGRTIYRDEVLVGVMDTPELAAEVVAALNERARADEMPSPLARTYAALIVAQAREWSRLLQQAREP